MSRSKTDPRLTLEIGSKCLIYSRSKKLWFEGIVDNIYIDDTTNKEWLEVKYSDKKRKKIQRFCEDLQAVDDNHEDIENGYSVINKIYTAQIQKDIVFGYINNIQQQLFPNILDNPFFKINELIKHLCFLYFYRKLFQSKILTDAEYDDLIELLYKNRKTDLISRKEVEWKLLYRANGDTLSKMVCIKRCYNKQSVFCLFSGAKGNVCGGYTFKGWDQHKPAYRSPDYDDPDAKDDKAFIFSIRSSKGWKPSLSNVEWKSKALINSGYFKQYCLFGDNYALFLENDGNIYCNGPEYVYQPFQNKYQLLGGQHGEKVQDVEIFQIRYN